MLRDRDAKFCRGFDDVFGTEGAEMLLTPVQAPNANAHAERWIRTVRPECLNWLLVLGCGHLEQVLRIYVQHDDAHRAHRVLRLQPPNPASDRRSPGWTGRREPTEVASSAGCCTSTDKAA